LHRSTATNRREIYAPFIAIFCLAGFAFRAALTVRPTYTPRWWGLFFARQMEPALAFCKTRLRAADGVSNDKIIFGKVAALNGPAQAFGPARGHSRGFEDANRAGWVNGRN
jgi:hypothetical protein